MIFSNDISNVVTASVAIVTPFPTTSLLASEFFNTASLSVFISLIKLEISVVFCLVISANFFISSATTANPLPCSPALAASIEAFKASKLVWLAILLIMLVILLISLKLLTNSLILLYVSSFCFCRVSTTVTISEMTFLLDLDLSTAMFVLSISAPIFELISSSFSLNIDCKDFNSLNWLLILLCKFCKTKFSSLISLWFFIVSESKSVADFTTSIISFVFNVSSIFWF